MNSEPSSSTQDRRQNTRRRAVAHVRMRVENPEIQGVTDNLSKVGMLFFSQDPVRVTLEIDEEGTTRRYTGKLVRVQRMKETSTGFAVEFDEQ